MAELLVRHECTGLHVYPYYELKERILTCYFYLLLLSTIWLYTMTTLRLFTIAKTRVILAVLRIYRKISCKPIKNIDERKQHLSEILALFTQ